MGIPTPDLENLDQEASQRFQLPKEHTLRKDLASIVNFQMNHSFLMLQNCHYLMNE
jgi:hypothetical protein